MTDEHPERTELSSLGEFGLIEELTKTHQTVQASTRLGVGDDAAVIDIGDGMVQVVSTDLLLDGIHFDLMYHPLPHLGYKAVAVNVSDICAMNAIPEQITVSIGMSNRFSYEAVKSLYEGVYQACRQYGVDLVGGDTSSSRQGLILSVTAIGRAKADQVAYRSGARPGDIVCVTGDLGGAYVGLQLLEREKQLYLDNPDVQPDLEDQSYVVGRQLKPDARLDVVHQLAKAGIKPTSMIDISDGLASDLFHLCHQSGCGVLIEEGHVPLRQETELLSIKFNLDPITSALSGGEDYELLFTVAPDDLEKVRNLPGLYLIGEMKDAQFGRKLLTTGERMYDLQAQGWQHFE